MTNEERQELIKDVQRRIKSTNRWISSNKSIGNPDGDARKLLKTCEIALSSLTAPQPSELVEVAKSALAAPQNSPQNIPEIIPGWQLVPVEPTEEMIAAGDQFMDGLSRLGDAYDAMLAAAPEVS